MSTRYRLTMNSTAAHKIIAIDGPAASGKSSVARELARRLGLRLRQLRRDVSRHDLASSSSAGSPPTMPSRSSSWPKQAPISCELRERDSLMLIDGVDPEPLLREDRVNDNVSRVSSVPRVREILVEHLRRYAADERSRHGRPRHRLGRFSRDALTNFTSTPRPRSARRRRAAQGQHDRIAARDQADSSRRASPLIIAEDAHVIDSSNLTIDGVVGEIIGRLKLKGLTMRAREPLVRFGIYQSHPADRADLLSFPRRPSASASSRKGR